MRADRPLELLKARLVDVDRLVLLGDVLELRHAPFAETLGRSRPVLESLAEALDGKEVVIVPGNHDYVLIRSWLERQLAAEQELALEQIFEPGECEPTAALAQTLGRADVKIAYPGIYLRPDVYATHGHYLDRSITVPSLERLAAGVMGKVVGAMPKVATPDDYEAALAPMYAWIDSLVRVSRGRSGAGSGASVKIWSQLAGDGGRRKLRAKLLAGVGLPLAVAGINRSGVGPVKTDLSASELRRAGIEAMVRVAVSLGVESPYVIYGHTHRPGPLPHDGRSEWLTPRGGSLLNSGSWVYSPAFVSTSAIESPYWPGTAISIQGDEPPEVERLLLDLVTTDLIPSGP